MKLRCVVSDSIGFAPGAYELSESFAAAEESGDLYPVEIEGFRRTKWGYTLDPDEEGHVLHRFTAADGCAFESFEFMPWLMLPEEWERTDRTYNKVEFSADGENYELLHENVRTYKQDSYWDLTDRVEGLNQFYIRVSAGFPPKTSLVHVRAAAKFTVAE